MSKGKPMKALAIINENACGIDIGSKFHMAAISMDEGDVKKFGVYTKDNEALIKWLKQNNVKHVAMESTGSYWQTLFSALQEAGFIVELIDGKQTKNLKKKTDVKDARAIYQLHSLGLLSGCFLPDTLTGELRNYYRHRTNLIEESSRLSNRMQQAMRLMNIRLDNVLNDIMGKSGKRIISSILEGKRDPKYLASLADIRVKKSQEEIENGLQGQWNDSQLFILEDCFLAYEVNQKRIKKTDAEIEKIMKENMKYELPKDKKLKKKSTEESYRYKFAKVELCLLWSRFIQY